MTAFPAPNHRPSQTGRKVLYRKCRCAACKRDTYHKVMGHVGNCAALKCVACGKKRMGIR